MFTQVKMTQISIKIFINEIFSKPPKKNYSTNKTDFYHIDDIWSLDILDWKDYGPENNRGYRYVLVVIANFSKCGWTIPLKNKNTQTITNSFEKITTTSKRKLNLIEIHRGKDFSKNIFQNFLNNNDVKHYSRYRSLGSIFVERFNRTIRNLLKKPVFERRDDNWTVMLPTILNQNNNRVHTSTDLTPIQASLKKNEGFVHKILLEKRKRIHAKFETHDLIRVADLWKTFSNGDTTNGSYNLYKSTENFNDTIPTNHIDNLPERYNAAILKNTALTIKQIDSVMKKLKIN